MFGLTPFTNRRLVDYYDPFSAMEEFERNFFGRQSSAFKTDIRETENAYVLEADLPGFSKEDIHAEVKNGCLTVSAERKSDAEQKSDKDGYIRRERSYGRYTRTFDVSGIKSNEITAAYKDGVLTLTLPKADVKLSEGRILEIE